jgi:hypothetical protein
MHPQLIIEGALYHSTIFSPSLHSPPSRVTYASVLFELSFLTSIKFKGLNSKHINLKLSFTMTKVLPRCTTNPSSQTMSTCCQQGTLLSRRASKSWRKECAICSQNTWKSTYFDFGNVSYKTPWLGFHQNHGVCHTKMALALPFTLKKVS